MHVFTIPSEPCVQNYACPLVHNNNNILTVRTTKRHREVGLTMMLM